MKPSKETLLEHVKHYDTQRIKHIYDEIVWLTAQIAASNVGMELVEAAKTGDIEKVKNVLETFKKEYSVLEMQIEEISNFHLSLGDPHIFAENDEECNKEILFKFDSEKIDIFNLFIFFWLSDIDPGDAFKNEDYAIKLLKEDGHPKMAEYLDIWGTDNLAEDFIKIFGNNK